MPKSSVAHALHRAVGEPLRERAVAVVEPFDRARERAVGVRVLLEDAAHDSNAARRAGAITAGRARTRRSSCALRPSGCTTSGTSAPSSRRARQIVTRRPCSSPHAPMCGESARTRRQASSGIVEVELAVGGRDLLGVGRRRPRAAARTSASVEHVVEQPRRDLGRAREHLPASSSPIGNRSCAAIGPASSSATVSWIVTPGLLVAGEDRALDRRGAAPARQQRRVHVQPERPLEQPRRDVAGRTRRRRRARPSSRQLGLLGLVHRDAEPLGRLLRGRRRELAAAALRRVRAA